MRPLSSKVIFLKKTSFNSKAVFRKWTFLKCPKMKNDCQTQKKKSLTFSSF